MSDIQHHAKLLTLLADTVRGLANASGWPDRAREIEALLGLPEAERTPRPGMGLAELQTAVAGYVDLGETALVVTPGAPPEPAPAAPFR